ncbi:MAG: peptide deformylase [Deltaproteobacteria bacterium]|nr:peptide deformylase [Deltaproteobacteria bacterium]
MMKFQGEPLSLKIFPDEVLRKVCEPVERFDAELRDLIEEMLVLMRTVEGVGLAAPQVGIAKRLFVCEIENRSLRLINPIITNVNGQAEMIEGCLSLPEVRVNVKRSNRLCVNGNDFKGRKKI